MVWAAVQQVEPTVDIASMTEVYCTYNSELHTPPSMSGIVDLSIALKALAEKIVAVVEHNICDIEKRILLLETDTVGMPYTDIAYNEYRYQHIQV